MMRWCARVVLQKEMQVANLIKDDRAIDNAWSINLVKLLNRVLFVKVEAEHSIEFLTVLSESTDQQYLGRWDLHRDKASNGRRDEQVHLDHFLLWKLKFLNGAESALVATVASKDEDGGLVEDAAATLRPVLV